MGKTTIKIHAILGSKKLFWVIFSIFILEASWIALSAVYPQAFDENFHFGLIKVYSHYWLPFLNQQPPGADAFGAVARDPAFLYHYLMSFPYRLIELFVHSLEGQVIVLRFINIALFASSIILFRKILKWTGLSKQLVNLILFLFILIPIVPQLAGQINYDNLLMPLIATACLLTFKIIDQINLKIINISTITWLLVVSLMATMVQYQFGPIFLATILYLGYQIYRKYKLNYWKVFSQLYLSWKQQSLILKLVLTVLVFFLLAMFIQRDGYNIYQYHTVAPSCDQVLSIDSCKQYSVWDANYIRHNDIANHSVSITYMNPVFYIGSWIYWMWYRLFFAINGINSFTNYPPLPLPIAALTVVLILATYSIIRYRKRVFYHNPYLQFMGLSSLMYITILIFEGYKSYLYTGTLELMNGRYLIPIIIFLAAIGGTALSISLKGLIYRKLFLGLFVLIMFLEGGGLLTFIIRSDSSWYWSNSTVVKVNHVAKKITTKIIVKGSKNYTTKNWFF